MGGTPTGGKPDCTGGARSELLREWAIGGGIEEGTLVGRVGETVGIGAPLGEDWNEGGGTG